MNYKQINDDTACVVNMKSMHVYEFFPSLNTARIKASELNGDNIQPSSYSILRYGQFLKLERASLLKPAVKITEEKWWEMLEILPPLLWESGPAVEYFAMSEFWTGNYTQMYGRHGDEYISKMVDYADKSTWIKLQDFMDARK